MKRSIGVTMLLIALAFGLAIGTTGCASGTQSAPNSSGAPRGPAGGGSY